MITSASPRFPVKPKTKSVMAAVLGAVVLVGALASVGMSPMAASAAATAAANLGSAANFSVLAGAAATIPGSTLGGEVGAATAITVDGNTVQQSTVHTVNDAATQTALSDATTAYNALMALPATGTLTGDDLGRNTAGSLLGRLLDHATVVVTDGESFRMREALPRDIRASERPATPTRRLPARFASTIPDSASERLPRVGQVATPPPAGTALAAGSLMPRPFDGFLPVRHDTTAGPCWLAARPGHDAGPAATGSNPGS